MSSDTGLSNITFSEQKKDTCKDEKQLVIFSVCSLVELEENVTNSLQDLSSIENVFEPPLDFTIDLIDRRNFNYENRIQGLEMSEKVLTQENFTISSNVSFGVILHRLKMNLVSKESSEICVKVDVKNSILNHPLLQLITTNRTLDETKIELSFLQRIVFEFGKYDFDCFSCSSNYFKILRSYLN